MTAKLIKNDRLARSQFLTQYVFHRLLAFISGELQNLQIHLVGNLLAVMPREQIVGEPKVAAREHLFAVPVISERTGFAY